jgi:hypothetical protein
LLETSSFTFDNKFIQVKTCVKLTFNKELCKEVETPKNARQKVYGLANVDEETWPMTGA